MMSYDEYLEEMKKHDKISLNTALSKAKFTNKEDNKNDRRLCEGTINQKKN